MPLTNKLDLGYGIFCQAAKSNVPHFSITKPDFHQQDWTSSTADKTFSSGNIPTSLLPSTYPHMRLCLLTFQRLADLRPITHVFRFYPKIPWTRQRKSSGEKIEKVGTLQ